MRLDDSNSSGQWRRVTFEEGFGSWEEESETINTA
jgi:hypothetical protein